MKKQEMSTRQKKNTYDSKKKDILSKNCFKF